MIGDPDTTSISKEYLSASDKVSHITVSCCMSHFLPILERDSHVEYNLLLKQFTHFTLKLTTIYSFHTQVEDDQSFSSEHHNFSPCDA